MKRIGHLYEKLLDIDYMEKSISKAFLKKKKTQSIKRILKNPRKHAKRIIYLIKFGKLPSMKDRKVKLICDGKMKKLRCITKASNYEHILHHAVIGLMESIFMRSSYRYSVASVPGRGDLYGKRHLERWIRSYKGRKLYVLKFDIKKFFDTIDRNIMMAKLESKIKDKRFLDILFRIVYFDNSASNRGIPIGYYTSQWFANFYLQSFDYFIKQDLRFPHYIRYMDDGVVLLQNKRKLRKAFQQISAYLSDVLCLQIKKNWQIYMLSYKPTWLMLEDGWNKKAHYGRPIDYMGYKFYPWKTTIRKSTLRSAMRSFRHFVKRPHVNNARSVMSYLGRLSHAQMHRFLLSKVYTIINVSLITDMISKNDKEKHIWNSTNQKLCLVR